MQNYNLRLMTLKGFCVQNNLSLYRFNLGISLAAFLSSLSAKCLIHHKGRCHLMAQGETKEFSIDKEL